MQRLLRREAAAAVKEQTGTNFELIHRKLANRNKVRMSPSTSAQEQDQLIIE